MERITTKERIWELDFLRGFAILMMVFDHFMWDFTFLDGYFSNFYEVDHPMFNWLHDFATMYWNSTLRFFGREFFVLVFLLVSGISFTFSKSNFKRGFKLLIVALLITLVTYSMDLIFNFGVLIVFGVIHMFAVNILLVALIRRLIHNEIIILFLGMLVITFSIIFGFFSPDPAALSFDNLFGIVIGSKAYGADHFGIFPYLGFILIGTVIGKTFYKYKTSLVPKVKISQKNVVMFAGRYSIWVYVLHQPIVLVLVLAFAYIFGYRF